MLTAHIATVASDVDPGETILSPKPMIVDEVRRTAEGITILGFSPDAPPKDGRRQRVKLEATAKDVVLIAPSNGQIVMLLDTIADALAADEKQRQLDAPGGEPVEVRYHRAPGELAVTIRKSRRPITLAYPLDTLAPDPG